MRSEPRYFVVALFTAAMMAASIVYAGTGSLVPYVAHAFDLPRAQLGFIASAIGLGAAAANIFAGILSDKYGDKAMLLLSGAVMGCSLVAAAALASYWWLLVWLFAYGIGFSAANPTGSHAILFFFKRAERGLAMGIRQTGVPLGGFAGALLISLVAVHFGYRIALVAAGLVVLLVTTLAAALYAEPAQLRGDRVPIRVLFADMLKIGRERKLILVTLTATLLLFVQAAFISFVPITLVHAGGYSAELAAAIFAAAHLAAVGGRLTWGRLSDGFFQGNRSRPLAVLAPLAALGALGFSFADRAPLWVVIAAALLLGFTGEGWFGLSNVAMAEIGGEEHAGAAVGFGTLFAYLAGIVAPLVVGALVAGPGYAVAWEVTAAMAALAMIPALLVP